MCNHLLTPVKYTVPPLPEPNTKRSGEATGTKFKARHLSTRQVPPLSFLPLAEEEFTTIWVCHIGGAGKARRYTVFPVGMSARPCR